MAEICRASPVLAERGGPPQQQRRQRGVSLAAEAVAEKRQLSFARTGWWVGGVGWGGVGWGGVGWGGVGWGGVGWGGVGWGGVGWGGAGWGGWSGVGWVGVVGCLVWSESGMGLLLLKLWAEG